MTRFKAFLIHFGISVAIFVVLAWLIVFVWYPQPFFAHDGGWQGIRIAALVDLVLGPGLTLIVFKAGKPGLKFDLTMIALAQTAALTWGVWTIHDQRTAMVVYADGAFYTLSGGQVAEAGDQAPEVLARSSERPAYAFVRLPEDPKELRGLRMTGLAGVPLYKMVERFEPLDGSTLGEVLAKSLDIEARALDHARLRDEFERLLASRQTTAETLAFVPLHCRYKSLILVLQRADGRVVGAIDVNPKT